jgi:hypothetical protein
MFIIAHWSANHLLLPRRESSNVDTFNFSVCLDGVITVYGLHTYTCSREGDRRDMISIFVQGSTFQIDMEADPVKGFVQCGSEVDCGTDAGTRSSQQGRPTCYARNLLFSC